MEDVLNTSAYRYNEGLLSMQDQAILYHQLSCHLAYLRLISSYSACPHWSCASYSNSLPSPNTNMAPAMQQMQCPSLNDAQLASIGTIGCNTKPKPEGDTCDELLRMWEDLEDTVTEDWSPTSISNDSMASGAANNLAHGLLQLSPCHSQHEQDGPALPHEFLTDIHLDLLEHELCSPSLGPSAAAMEPGLPQVLTQKGHVIKAPAGKEGPPKDYALKVKGGVRKVTAERGVR